MQVFEKKQYIYSETMGVCQVTDIVKLAANNRMGEPVPYYLLKSVSDKSKVAYIPVEKHQVTLRPLISREAAEAVTEDELAKMSDLKKAEVRFVLGQTMDGSKE